ncbi:MAG TPA: cytochrome c [Kofleriaceae bacterium]|nr:cytochrome c [Kofleriaceae bacterium]
MLRTEDDQALLDAERTSTIVMVIILIGLIMMPDLFGCGSKRRGELVGRPITPDTLAEKRGERLFYKYCSSCHPSGEAGLGPALNNKPLPEFAVRTQIRQGVGAMPAFHDDRLTDAQVEEIASFVSELRQTNVAHR